MGGGGWGVYQGSMPGRPASQVLRSYAGFLGGGGARRELGASVFYSRSPLTISRASHRTSTTRTFGYHLRDVSTRTRQRVLVSGPQS